jgi:hypothetical protein
LLTITGLFLFFVLATIKTGDFLVRWAMETKVLPIQGYLQYASSVDSLKQEKMQHIDPVKLAGGAVVGSASGMGLEVLGPETYLHENGHKTAMELLYNYPPGQGPQVVDYQFQNLQNFLTHPSFNTLDKLVSMYTPQPGVGGYTTWGNPSGLSILGKVLGQNGAAAAVDAAGSVSELGLSMAEFAAGFKLRKSHPLLGYTLMTMSAIPYSNALPYILSPLQGAGTMLSGNTGNDWVNFAHESGINPAVTGAVAGASLPGLALVLWLMEKHEKEEAKNRFALARLIQSGKISQNELEREFQAYPRKAKIEALEAKVQEALSQNKVKEAQKATLILQKEYARFSNTLVHHYKPLVEEEKKCLGMPRVIHPLSALHVFFNNLKKAYSKDKPGTALRAGSMALVAGSSVARMAERANALPAAGSMLGTLVPAAGILATASAAYRAGKAWQNKLPRSEKASQALLAGFSGLSTAGLLVPGIGWLFTLAGLAGMASVYLAHHFAEGHTMLQPAN